MGVLLLQTPTGKIICKDWEIHKWRIVRSDDNKREERRHQACALCSIISIYNNHLKIGATVFLNLETSVCEISLEGGCGQKLQKQKGRHTYRSSRSIDLTISSRV